MLEIVFTPNILGTPKSGAQGLSLFSLMVNPHLGTGDIAAINFVAPRKKLF